MSTAPVARPARTGDVVQYAAFVFVKGYGDWTTIDFVVGNAN
jgi:hypothetical protein